MSRFPLARFVAALVVLLSRPSAAQPLVAHIIAHSHCDPGWLESFEGYYSTQVASILSSVMQALREDPSRRFIWAEMSFWMRWWEVQSADTQALVHRLVRAGQLEFVGGGWVQNDEANPDFGAVVSQISEGHEYLKSLFGVRARHAWQVDPFGHAAAFAAVAAAAGFEALVINRIDHTVKDALKARAAMEFDWRPYFAAAAGGGGDGDSSGGAGGTESRGRSYANASIFTHVLHTHYSAPKGFDFENPEGVPISEGNVAARASYLVTELRSRSKAYRTSHLLVPFGDDFKFQDAGRQFRNMDQLVRHVNSHSTGGGEFEGVVLRYSTLSDYFDAVFAESGGSAALANPAPAAAIPFPVYSPRSADDGGADFFPYADNQHSFWTGYFVSRPQLKGAIRRTTSLLRGADALLALVRPWAAAWQREAGIVLEGAFAGKRHVQRRQAAAVAAAPYATYSWLRAFQRVEQVRLDAALCLHHDAITGTSRDSVVTDYTRRMAEGNEDLRGLIADLASLVLGGLHKRAAARAGGDAVTSPEGSADGGSDDSYLLAPAPLTYVRHVLPVSASVSVSLTSDGTVTRSALAEPVVVFNAASWQRSQAVHVIVDIAGGEADSSASVARKRCRGSRWPFAIVSDDLGRVVRSQWLAVVEDSSAAANLQGPTGEGGVKAPAACVFRDSQGRALVPSCADEDPPAWSAVGVRYELVFLADVPPLSLSTFFVTVAWSGSITEDADASGSAAPGVEVCGPANALARRLGAAAPSTAIVLPSVKDAGVPECRQTDSSESGRRLVVVAESAASAAADAGAQPPGAPSSGAPLILENACLRVEVNAATGLISAVTRKLADEGGEDSGEPAEAVRIETRQTFSAYNTMQSGAYIFRPVQEPVALSQGQGGAVTVSLTSEPVDASGPAGLVQVLRVVGPRWGQTVRLTNTLGWRRDAAAAAGDDASAARGCRDPSVPDGSFEVVPTLLEAHGNEEVVMGLEASIDISQLSGAADVQDGLFSTNARDHIGSRTSATLSAADAVTGESADASAGTQNSVPRGFWTSDGLGLLRRPPANVHESASNLMRHFYPLNTLARISGAVVTPGADDAVVDDDSGAVAWLSLYTQQPFGAMARQVSVLPHARAAAASAAHEPLPGAAPQQPEQRARLYTRLEVMLHRHLSQDDGRGLSTGVIDATKISPTLLVTLGASRGRPPAASALRAAGQHEDWSWRWAARSALHVQPLLVLHADLDAARPAAPAADGSAPAVEPASKRRLAPPLDPSVGLGVDPLPGASGAGEPRFDTAGGSGEYALALAEAALPISAWTSRFGTRFRGLSGGAGSSADSGAGSEAGGSPLPPWVQISTLQARDAATDDVLLRLQSFGALSARVSVPRLFASGGLGRGLRVGQVRPRRSLSMSMGAGAEAPKHAGIDIGAVSNVGADVGLADLARAGYPAASLTLLSTLQTEPALVRRHTANVLNRLGSRHARVLDSGSLDAPLDAAALQAAAEAAAAAANQNTDEEGVFISDAAMEKAKAAAQQPLAQGRLLAEVGRTDDAARRRASRAARGAALSAAAPQRPASHTVAMPPRSFASLILTLDVDLPPLAKVDEPSKAAISKGRSGGKARAPMRGGEAAPPARARGNVATEPELPLQPAGQREADEERIERAFAMGELSASERLRLLLAARQPAGLTSIDSRKLTMILSKAPAPDPAAAQVPAPPPVLAPPARPAGGAALPRDPWEKRFLEFESRDFFEELRRKGEAGAAKGGKEAKRPPHDHDAEPVRLDFLNAERPVASAPPGAAAAAAAARAGGPMSLVSSLRADTFTTLAAVGLFLWLSSLLLFVIAMAHCFGCCSFCAPCFGSGRSQRGPRGARGAALLKPSVLPMTLQAAQDSGPGWGALPTLSTLKRLSNPSKTI